MRLQQAKETYFGELDLQKTAGDSANLLGMSIAVGLPKIRPEHSRNRNGCFKDYQNGTKIINQLPLLIFKSEQPKTPQKMRILRYKTEQKKEERFDPVSPFFMSYIRKSLQKRKSQRRSQNKSLQSPKRPLIQAVSLDSISLYSQQTPNNSIKPSLKNPTLARYNAFPILKPQPKNVPSKNLFQVEELKIERKEIKLATKLPRPILHLKCKFNSQRHTSLEQFQGEVSPWADNQVCQYNH